ncbi:MAG: prepilin-type N-terminal cleavage/methylation domain-containing protein [Bacteroidetes bacterium]|nr:MAG: prepilin-type N-terminal cleavage/methylation domain-containing protein [Bacteroidota bacterium]
MMVAGLNGRQSGFTLVEVMVAMLIIAIALLALAGLLIQTMRSNQAAEERLNAASASQEVLDRYAQLWRDGKVTSFPVTGVYRGFQFTLDAYALDADVYSMHIHLAPSAGGRMAGFDNYTAVLK